jgi:hypothetical protein
LLGSLWFNSFSAGGGGAAGDFELISTTVLGSNAASVTLTLPGSASTTYKHLQIRGMARTSTVTGYTSAGIRFNGDTASNYSAHELVGSNGSVSSGGAANQTAPNIWRISGGSLNSNIFGSAIIDILDAFDTNKYKTVRCLSGMEGGSGNSVVQITSGGWRSSSAISTITFVDASAGNFVTGSRFSLYGLKA